MGTCLSSYPRWIPLSECIGKHHGYQAAPSSASPLPIASSLPSFFPLPRKSRSHFTCYLLQKFHLDHTRESHCPEHLKSSLWSSPIPLGWPHASTSEASISLLKHWLWKAGHTMGHPRLGQNWPADLLSCTSAPHPPCSHLMCPSTSQVGQRNLVSKSGFQQEASMCVCDPLFTA